MTRSACGSAGSPSEEAGLSEAEVRRVESFVRERLAGPVRVAAMAEAVGRSASCFARLFRAATGETPHAYLTRLRVERARELIVEDNGMSLAEIAARCGFSDQSHLTRVFKRVSGETPAGFCKRSGVRPPRA